MKSIVGFFIFLQIAFSWQSQQVTVSVFYETKCPDSIKFITQQLVPAWKMVGGGAGNSLFVIDYVPYGKATEEKDADGVVTTKCHHGEEECNLNKIHACALRKLPKPEITPFINCSLLMPNIGDCTEASKLARIERCVTEEGKELTAEHGNRTKQLNPPLTWVPWILFDGKFSSKDLELAQKNFTEIICLKSQGCDSDSRSSSISKSSLLQPVLFTLYTSIITILIFVKIKKKIN